MSAERMYTITRQSLREWLQPAGAGDAEAKELPDPALVGGPGDIVKIILDKLGIKPTRNCGCEAMRRQMNEWGYTGCWKHRDIIAEWFRAKAVEAGSDLSVSGITKLVIEAVSSGRAESVR